jgi:hypothetical protein
VCPIFTEAAEPSDVGRRLDTHIFRKAREAFTVGVEWPLLKPLGSSGLARSATPARFPPAKSASAKSERKRTRDVACACEDGVFNSGKSYVFEPLESQLASVTGG